MTVSQYFSGLFGGIKSLLIGMSVTMKELFTKKVTQQYPENRKTLVIPPRVRGNLTMPHDENNEHACTACGICQMNCPNGTITVKSEMIQTEDGKKKKVLTEYIYDLGRCTFCNLCVLTCPSDAIVFSNEFENALFTKSKLIEKLNQEGSKLREKKKEPKPAVAPAPKAEVKKDETPVAPAKEEGTAITPQAEVPVQKEDTAAIEKAEKETTNQGATDVALGEINKEEQAPAEEKKADDSKEKE